MACASPSALSARESRKIAVNVAFTMLRLQSSLKANFYSHASLILQLLNCLIQGVMGRALEPRKILITQIILSFYTYS